MSDFLFDSQPKTNVQPETTPKTEVDTNSIPDFLKGVTLDAELLNEPAIKNMKDLPSLVKSYVHAQKMVGSDKVVIPSKNATPEQWNEVFTKLGLPKKEEYKITKAEKSYLGDAFYSKAAEIAHSAGILPHQMQNFISNLEKDAESRFTENQKTHQKAQEESVNGLKKEWGEAFDAKIQNAKEVLEKFADEETKNYIRDTGLGREPKMLKFLANLGTQLREARVIEGKADAGTPADIQTMVDGIMKDRNHPYWNKDHVGHANAVKEFSELMQKLHG